MSGETVITVIGNLTNDPELRYSPSGHPVANWTVASTPRTFDRQSQEWKDGQTLFMRCSAWREMAENVAESLTRGTRVIVTGRLGQRTYTPKDGGPDRTVVELEVDEVGPSLRYATTKVSKVQRGGSAGGFQGGGGNTGGGYGDGGYRAPQGGYSQPQGRTEDPWATGPSGGGGYAPAGQPADPPF